MRTAPRQRTIAVQMATVMLTTGERSALMLRAFSAAPTVAWLTAVGSFSSVFSWPKALTTCMDSRPCWTTATISALFLADFVSRCLHRLLEPGDEEQQEWRDRRWR